VSNDKSLFIKNSSHASFRREEEDANLCEMALQDFESLRGLVRKPLLLYSLVGSTKEMI